MEDLGFKDVEIISPSNKNSYADFSRGQGVKFRLVAWRGLVAAEILGKLRQERKPYEAVPGQVEEVYQKYLGKLVHSVETGAGDSLVPFRPIHSIHRPKTTVRIALGVMIP